MEIRKDRLRVRVVDEQGAVADEFEVTDTESPPTVRVTASTRDPA